MPDSSQTLSQTENLVQGHFSQRAGDADESYQGF